jgi:hypothetical protein
MYRVPEKHMQNEFISPPIWKSISEVKYEECVDSGT